MVDTTSFERELMQRLKHDRMMFLHEILDLGKKMGLQEYQILRIIEHAEISGVGLMMEVFVYATPFDEKPDPT